jgi:hypothetical protein
LASGVPQAEVDHLVVELDCGSVVIEDGRHVLSGELVLGVAACGREYLMRRQVLPTAPSPTTTTLMGIASYISINQLYASYQTPRIYIHIVQPIHKVFRNASNLNSYFD